jgi:hypothetical protein
LASADGVSRTEVLKTIRNERQHLAILYDIYCLML